MTCNQFLKSSSGKFLFCMLLILFDLLHLHSLQAQTYEETKDFKDVVRKIKKDTTAVLNNNISVGKLYVSFLPVVGYAPANGFVLGAAISFSKLFAEKNTSLSNGMLNFQVTSKKQFIINARSKIYLKNNEWFLQGDWRLMLFAQPTYGLGINNSGGNEYLLAINELPANEPPLAEDMRFNYIRIYEDVVRHVGSENWYVGGGIAFDHHFAINDQKLNTDTSSADYFITNHYAYSKKYEFDEQSYSTNGINFNVLTDNRDHIANPYKGYYASLTFRYNPKIGRSSQQSIMALYDFRYYLNLSKTCPRHLIAFWSYGTFVMDGNVPYLALPSIGWDTYNRSGRGYIQGRYRGLSMLYNEAEYRFPLSDNGMFGGVAFVNTTFAESTTQKLFDKTATGLGVGFRMKMDKRARINLTVDYGFGLDKSSGIYFNMQETF